MEFRNDFLIDAVHFTLLKRHENRVKDRHSTLCFPIEHLGAREKETARGSEALTLITLDLFQLNLCSLPIRTIGLRGGSHQEFLHELFSGILELRHCGYHLRMLRAVSPCQIRHFHLLRFQKFVRFNGPIVDREGTCGILQAHPCLFRLLN